MEEKKNTGLGVTALVLAIIGLLTGIIGIGLILDLVAIILAIIALVKKNNKNGLPIAAMIIAMISLILTVIIGGMAFTNITKYANEWGITSLDNVGTQIEESVEERIEEEIMENVEDGFGDLDIDLDSEDLEAAVDALSEGIEQLVGEDTNGDGLIVMPNDYGLTEEDLEISRDGYIDEYGMQIEVLVIKNNSDKTPIIRIRTEKITESGVVDYSAIARTVLPAQSEIAIIDYMAADIIGEVKNVIEVDTSAEDVSMIPYIEYEIDDKGSIVTVEYTNNGEIATTSLSGTLLFISEGETVAVMSNLVTDDELELKAGATIAVDYEVPEAINYDELKLYIFDPQ